MGPVLAMGKPLPKRGFNTHHMGFCHSSAAAATAKRRLQRRVTALKMSGLSRPRWWLEAKSTGPVSPVRFSLPDTFRPYARVIKGKTRPCCRNPRAMRAHIRIPQAGNLTIGGRLEPSSTMEDSWRTVVSGETWDSSRYTPSSDSTAERSSIRPRESRSRSMPRVEPWEIRAASRRLSSAMMLIRSRAPVGGVEEGRGDEGVDCSAPRRIVSMTTWFLTFKVWVRGKSSSGQTVKPRTLCCSASWEFVQSTASRAVLGSSRIRAA